MWQALWRRTVISPSELGNLEDLRGQLTNRLALLLIGVSALAMWLTLPLDPFPLLLFELGASFLVLGLGVQVTIERHPKLARHLLVWGLTICLILTMELFSDPWLPFVGLLLIFVSAMLVSGGEWLTGTIIAGVAAWFTYSGTRVYPLPALLVVLALGVAITWLAVYTLYTTLQWTRNMQQRADYLLEEVRNHRAELSRALKSSEIANSLLRRTQRELILARKQADEARRLKEQFAANISHELRTPLNLILGFSEMMYRSPEVYGDLPWSPTLRRDIYQVYRSSRHLIEMIDDILDLSRFEIAEFTLNKEPTPLTTLLNDTAAIATDLFRGSHVPLEVDIPADLPTLELDRTRIRQVLLNLLNNARRFTGEGMVQLAVTEREHEIVISVSDTGPGIPADKLPYIFDEFFQVDLSLRRSHQGAGLGLAISKRFVQMHGGSIWVDSEAGEGSTFAFSLPKSGSYIPMSEGSGEPEPEWFEERLPSILVVDPDPGVIAMIRRRLEGYEVIQVAQRERLMEAIALNHPRAVLCNEVPDVVLQCRQKVGDIPVPLIECSLPSQAWLAEDLAVTASLTKPIMADQLLGQIERLGEIQDILVIDDDRGFAQMVQRMLEASGKTFRVRRAYDGEEGLREMLASPPDLILLDLMMPVKDGFQVLAEMREIPELAKIPVVVLTATSFAEDALQRGSGRFTISRADGLRPTDVLSFLVAVLEVLRPYHDEQLATVWIDEAERL